jgi:hypothetical protein
MRMARRAAEWVAWAEWTCDIRQVPVTVKESGLRPALCFGRQQNRRVEVISTHPPAASM